MSAHATRFPAWRRPALLAAIASVALAAGTLVYLGDREPGHAALVPAHAVVARGAIFGVLGQWLPSFVHPFAFGLLTAAVLPAKSMLRYSGCAAWGLVNVAFELGQHRTASAWWARSLDAGGISSWLARYFIHGTFDPGDIVAAGVGALAAAALLLLPQCGPEHRHEQ